MQGTSTKTLYCLLPHQGLRSKDTLTGQTYRTSRGEIQLAEGNGFTTTTPFQGVLPVIPDVGIPEPARLSRYVNDEAANYKFDIADTYWTGKALGKLATLSAIADATNNKPAQKQALDKTKALLEDYFTAAGTPKGIFYYNKPWGTLIGYPASFGSDEALNDHHFHYGYFIRAAAEVLRQDPQWGSKAKWGPMVEMLIRDCANPSRTDPMFPFLRNFDIYEGHTWADGKGDFADGNNNESSSEAMNAWTGLILWGELMGNKAIRDAGIYLYVTEKDAIDKELEIFQDLQRLQADFVNYRARVERDRGAERQAAIAEAIRAFLPALDDLTRAESHGDLEEGTPMAAVATKLKNAGEKFGLKSFGAKGDKFDPEHHDALVQTPNAEVSEAVIADVIELGYMIGDRMLRPAKVAVFVTPE